MIDRFGPSFVMFSLAHIAAVIGLSILVIVLFSLKNKWSTQSIRSRRFERLFALSLLVMEVLYHVWLLQTGRWSLANSLPLELCSISLLMTIILLWTGNKHVYDLVFYAGIGLELPTF